MRMHGTRDATGPNALPCSNFERGLECNVGNWRLAAVRAKACFANIVAMLRYEAVQERCADKRSNHYDAQKQVVRSAVGSLAEPERGDESSN